MGEEGVNQCRSLLDGLDGPSNDAYLQHVISEGRCVVCNQSTFEEDMLAQAEKRNQTGGCAEIHAFYIY